MKSSINMTDREKLEAIVDGMARLVPEAGFSFGYIGNLSLQYGDDRCWYIFTQLLDEKGKDISFGGFKTENLHDFLQLSNRKIVAWYNKVNDVIDAEFAYNEALKAGKSVIYRRFRK